MKKDFWSKIRLLVTNQCNYKCPFCHNEGQDKSNTTDMMSFEDFKVFIDIIKDQTISEFHFSGGEPFLNSDLVKMIEYVNDNTEWGIGCATNLSMLTKVQIYQLARTRVKFNIQFPFANELLYQKSTGNGSYKHILTQIDNVKQAGIKIGLNAVIQSDNIENIKELIMFALYNQLPLKLLPQIGLDGSEHFKKIVYPILKKYSISFEDKNTGATRWVIAKDGNSTTILYIDSPCFDKNINQCKKFGELRIHPNMRMQTCILKNNVLKLDLLKGRDVVLLQMRKAWKDLKHC